MFRLKMKKDARQRDAEREEEKHSVKKKHQRAIPDMNLGNARGRQLGVQTEGASVLVKSSLIEIYFQGLFSMKQFKKYFTEVVA